MTEAVSPATALPSPSDLSVRCVARWIELGLTSRTNPVLRHALDTFIHPLGIVCEALEFEPFGVLENGAGGLHFHRPVFDPAKVKAASLRSLVRQCPSIKATVAVSGHALFDIPPGAGDAKTIEAASAEMTYAVAQGVDHARAFILRAAAVLVDDETPAIVRNAYLSGDVETFITYVEQHT